MISAVTPRNQRNPRTSAFGQMLTPARRAQLVRGKVALVALSRMVWRWL